MIQREGGREGGRGGGAERERERDPDRWYHYNGSRGCGATIRNLSFEFGSKLPASTLHSMTHILPFQF